MNLKKQENIMYHLMELISPAEYIITESKQVVLFRQRKCC